MIILNNVVAIIDAINTKNNQCYEIKVAMLSSIKTLLLYHFCYLVPIKIYVELPFCLELVLTV